MSVDPSVPDGGPPKPFKKPFAVSNSEGKTPSALRSSNMSALPVPVPATQPVQGPLTVAVPSAATPLVETPVNAPLTAAATAPQMMQRQQPGMMPQQGMMQQPGMMQQQPGMMMQQPGMMMPMQGGGQYMNNGMVSGANSFVMSMNQSVNHFGHMSNMMQTNFQSVHGLFDSLFRLVTSYSMLKYEFAEVIRFFTVFKLLAAGSGRVKSFFYGLVGKKASSRSDLASAWASSGTGPSWFSLVLLGVLGYQLVKRLIRNATKTPSDSKDAAVDKKGGGGPTMFQQPGMYGGGGMYNGGGGMYNGGMGGGGMYGGQSMYGGQGMYGQQGGMYGRQGYGAGGYGNTGGMMNQMHSGYARPIGPAQPASRSNVIPTQQQPPQAAVAAAGPTPSATAPVAAVTTTAAPVNPVVMTDDVD